MRLSRGSHATVVNYIFEFFPTHEKMTITEETPYILTPPKASRHASMGRKYMARARDGPFLFTVPVSGVRPITVEARGLPEGLSLDKTNGVITGTPLRRGEHVVQLTARNVVGSTTRDLAIVIGDTLALTPPMGWNSWNCWGLAVDQQKILASAHAFKAKGLIDHGWTYVNIDDGWEIKGDSPAPKRESDGRIRDQREISKA